MFTLMVCHNGARATLDARLALGNSRPHAGTFEAQETLIACSMYRRRTASHDSWLYEECCRETIFDTVGRIST
jgi:hypothetical protein